MPLTWPVDLKRVNPRVFYDECLIDADDYHELCYALGESEDYSTAIDIIGSCIENYTDDRFTIDPGYRETCYLITRGVEPGDNDISAVTSDAEELLMGLLNNKI